MTFCIISHVLHTQNDHTFFAYSPYVNEMNIWLKFVDKVIVVAPIENFKVTALHNAYQHDNIHFVAVDKFNTLSIAAIFKSFVRIPINCWRIFKAMKAADHIHLRCPGNMGLLGCIIQIGFPKKQKSAKYAGNWDPNSPQPLSYRIQKWILKNPFLTKNIQVLVYGKWDNKFKNIKPFFTATYHESEKVLIAPRNLKDTLEFIYVGTLSQGKQPLYAIRLIEKLIERNRNVRLSLYGEGPERSNLEHYIQAHNLGKYIKLQGVCDKETIKEVYQKSHFLLLPSKSEGWPKVVAEAMFWGCVPVAAKVSCIPFMLDLGSRGILLSNDLPQDVSQLVEIYNAQECYNNKANLAMEWSRKYTTDLFESEIQKIIRT